MGPFAIVKGYIFMYETNRSALDKSEYLIILFLTSHRKHIL